MPTVLLTGPTVTQDSPFSSLAVAVTIASTHFVYPRRDDQAELAWVAWLNTKTVYPRKVTHLSINQARRRVTSLICPTTLPLSQTFTYRSNVKSFKLRIVVQSARRFMLCEINIRPSFFFWLRTLPQENIALAPITQCSSIGLNTFYM